LFAPNDQRLVWLLFSQPLVLSLQPLLIALQPVDLMF